MAITSEMLKNPETLRQLADAADAIADQTPDRKIKVEWGHLAGVARKQAERIPPVVAPPKAKA